MPVMLPADGAGFVHPSSRLADGREAVYFSDRGAPPVEHVPDRRSLGERSGHGQVRFDRLTGEWVAVAGHRQARTHLPPADRCPLCPAAEGRESEVPAEDFDVVVLENRFPSLGPELGQLPALGPAGERALWGAPSPAYGRCELALAEGTAARFTEVFGRAPDGVWRDPGRVDLIGEHTDYNDGFVLPFALDRAAMAAVRLRRDTATDDVVDLVSTWAPGGGALSRARLRITGLAPGSVGGWGAYPAGVVHVLAGLDGVEVPGFELLLDSTVPAGAGLSSSHAVEVATITALNDLLGLGLDRNAMARLTQRAENEFVGAPTGIMDQSASLLGRAGAALLLDRRSLVAELVPLQPAQHGLTVLVVDTRLAHSHADGGYAARRASCERAAAALGVASPREGAGRVL